jgi:Arc/MetJ-type ribon-helix-helix transcriptional regulator
MDKVDKVTIRLSAEQAQALDSLIDTGKYKNRSKAIRAAIDEMISPEPRNIGDIRVKLPDTMLAEIEMLVAGEYFPSVELGIREMIRNQLVKIDVTSIMERKNLRDEMVAERKAASDILDDAFSNYVKQ